MSDYATIYLAGSISSGIELAICAYLLTHGQPKWALTLLILHVIGSCMWSDRLKEAQGKK